MPFFLVSGAIFVGSAIYAHLAWRAVKSLRALAAEDDLRAAWRNLGPARQRTIRRKLRRGEPVTDPTDAVALRTVERTERLREILRPINRGAWLLFALMFVLLISMGKTTIALVAGAALVLLFAPLVVASAWISRRYRESAAATRRLFPTDADA